MRKKQNRSTLTRRDFLQIAAGVGGAAALSAFLEGCSNGVPATAAPPASTAAPVSAASVAASPSPEMTATEPISDAAEPTETATQAVGNGKARVALIQTGDRADGVRRAIALLGVNPAAGKRVFLKPNFNSADPAPGSTHPDTLRALVQMLQEMGAPQITLGDRSGMGDTRQVMEQIGVFQMADELGFDAVVFDELPDEAWVMINPPDGHWQQGFPFSRICAEAEAIVQTCCLKTHRYGGHFTLSLKNSVGLAAKRLQADGYNYMTELHSSPDQRRMIAEINSAYQPGLVVMDAVEAFISGGPDQGERVSPGVMLAGVDRVAIDAVGVAILRHFGCQTEASRGKIFEQEQIVRAVELGIGVDGPEKIEIITENEAGAAFADSIRLVLSSG